MKRRRRGVGGGEADPPTGPSGVWRLLEEPSSPTSRSISISVTATPPRSKQQTRLFQPPQPLPTHPNPSQPPQTVSKPPQTVAVMSADQMFKSAQTQQNIQRLLLFLVSFSFVVFFV